MIRTFSSKNAPPSAPKPGRNTTSSMLQDSILTKAYAAGHFSLEIDGVLVEGTSSVDGLESLSEVIEYKDGEDGVSHFKPGVVIRNRLVVRKDWSNTSEFFKWRKAVLDGKVDRRSISVIFHNDAGEKAGRMDFFECWPVRYVAKGFDSRSSGHATEKLEISWETMELKAG